MRSWGSSISSAVVIHGPQALNVSCALGISRLRRVRPRAETSKNGTYPKTWRRQSPALAAAANPLERYTEMTFEALLPHAQIFYAHRPYAGAYLPFQALAVATGLGANGVRVVRVCTQSEPNRRLLGSVSVRKVADGDEPRR